MRKKKLLLLSLLFFVLMVQSVNAQEPSPTPTPIHYELPYPGILPGNPLYFLKDTRDAIAGFMISSPAKKAEFDLLQADKNLQASVLLWHQKQKSSLVFSTLNRAEEYFDAAIVKTAEAKKQGITLQDFVTKLSLANLKHQETVLMMAKSATGEDKKVLLREQERIKKMGLRVKELRHK